MTEAEYVAILAQLIDQASTWSLTASSHEFRPSTKFLWWSPNDSLNDIAVDELATTAVMGDLVAKFPDGSALTVELRRRRWCVLAEQPQMTAHENVSKTQRLFNHPRAKWRRLGLQGVVLMYYCGALFFGGLMVWSLAASQSAVLTFFFLSLFIVFYFVALIQTMKGLLVSNRFLPKRFPLLNFGPINVTQVIGAGVLVVITVLVTRFLGK